MLKISPVIAAVALALSSLTHAQELPNQSDMFGQEPSALESTSPAANLAVQPAPRRVSIVNGPQGLPAGQAGANGVANQQAGEALRRADAQAAAKARPKSEFQKFIFENAGKDLPVFGAAFFANAPSTFAPILNSPVPADYRLGPGDELLVRGWGSIDIDYRATIDRNGTIAIPTVGTVVLAGVRAGDAEGLIRAAVGRMYKGVTVNVNFGQLRAITVYVVGHASSPGTYTVSSMSTLVTALFASGGPNPNGSMRNVQVKRGGKVVAELDLYAFIAKGDKSADIKLQDGDSIYIPPAGGYVALTGKVNSPAIYELKSRSDTVETLLDFAGGVPVVADPRRAFLERIDPGSSRPRTVEEFALTGEGMKRTLKNGDVLNITSITPDFANAVILRGNVDQPIRASFRSGMRVSDLIPSREYLLTRASTRRQNSLASASDEPRAGEGEDKTESIAARIGNLIDEVNWDYAVVERINRADLSVSLVPFNLAKVFSNPSGPDNIVLQPGDTVTIFSQHDVAVPVDRRKVFVRVEGEVAVPGVYQMSAGDTLQSLLAKAGGPTNNAYLFATEFYRETVRKQQAQNLEKAALRLEAQLRNEQARVVANSRSAEALAIAEAQRQAAVQTGKEVIERVRHLKPNGRIAFSLSPDERSFARLPALKLENGDRLVVPARSEFVNIVGAVNAEASPLWRPNARLKDYLDTVGVTTEADTDNVFVMRVDGTVVSERGRGWFGSIGSLLLMPGDTIVVPEKFDKESAWTKFTQGTREWAQIFANFGLGVAAVKTLSD
ncbi:SLBB domain-containing protein [Massilia sp. SYSU DXS3249]